MVVDRSHYAFILAFERNSRAHCVPVVSSSTQFDNAAFEFAPEDWDDESFLSTLRMNEPLAIGYDQQVFLGECRRAAKAGSGKQTTYLAGFEILRTDFLPPIEPSLGNLTADRLAEMRAERLLLNNHIISDTTDVNEITKDIFIAGQDTTLRILSSPFPSLFKSFGQEPTRFLEMCWITAVAQLKLSACVATISKLELRLEDASTLFVSFRGTRKQRGPKWIAHEIFVDGLCSLLGRGTSEPPVDVGQLGTKLRELSAKISVVGVAPETASKIATLVAQIDQLLKEKLRTKT